MNNTFSFNSCVTDINKYKTNVIDSVELIHGEKHFEIDNNSTDMTKSYNILMNANAFKYKVYLHQDVMIINPNFIQDCLDIFKDPEIGMIGMAGCGKFPRTGTWWDGDKVGKVYDNCQNNTGINSLMSFNDDGGFVEGIDGLIMVTQYD